MAASQGASWIAVSVESSEPARRRGAAPPGAEPRRSPASSARRWSSPTTPTSPTRSSGSRSRTTPPRSWSASPATRAGSTSSAGGNLVDRLLRIGGADRHLRRAGRARGREARHLARLAPGRGLARRGNTRRSSASSRRSPLAGWFIVPHSGYLSVGLFFLLAVIVLSLRVGPGPVLVAGVVSALTWDFLFIPPLFTFAIARFEDGLMFFTYFVVAHHLRPADRARPRPGAQRAHARGPRDGPLPPDAGAERRAHAGRRRVRRAPPGRRLISAPRRPCCWTTGTAPSSCRISPARS